VDRALERSRSASRDRERGQTNLFGMFGGSGSGKANAAAAAGDEYPTTVEWDRMDMLRRERAALGCYVSGHPLFRYQSKLPRIGALATHELASQKPWSAASVAGMVENYQERLFKGGSGGRAAFFQIEDQGGRVEAKVRGDRIDTYSALLTCGEPVIVSGKVSFPMSEDPDEEREPTLLVDGVELLSDAALRATRAISIRLDAERTRRHDLEKLKELLLASPGSCPVELVLEMKDGAQAVMDLPGTRVTPDGTLLGGLERTFGGPVAELR
jgi:DNA polymerase-3 subunit alpha